MFDDRWMEQSRVAQRPVHGDLRDLIFTGSTTRAPLSPLARRTLCRIAYKPLKLYDVSQVPVVDGHRCVGLLDQSDILVALTEGTLDFNLPVKRAMVGKLVTVQANTPPERLLPLFDRGLVAIVVDGERFLGLITRIDLLNHLRRKIS